MYLTHQDLTIRDAVPDDAPQFAAWWNDGAVMAYVGFPRGLNTTPQAVADDIADMIRNHTYHLLIVQQAGRPIGEMGWRDQEAGAAEIDIKICDLSLHDRGLGKRLLSMLLSSLFRDLGYRRAVLSVNPDNRRAWHVYERLGFRRVRVLENTWRDQLGRLQSAAEYELRPEDLVDFTLEA